MSAKHKKLYEESDSDDDEPLTSKYVRSEEGAYLPLKPAEGGDEAALQSKLAESGDEEPLFEDQGAGPSRDDRTLRHESEPVFIHNRNARSDTVYESLDYEICENKLWLDDHKKISPRFTLRKDIARWLTFVLIGILTALIACTIDIVIESLSAIKYTILKEAVDKNTLDGDLFIPYLYWVLISIAFVSFGSALVAYVEPVAAGSGIPIVKSYLNGIKVPRIVRIKTLTVKAIGVVTSVVGGLAGGKEGPMIHAGAVVAAGISQGKSTTFVKDFKVFKYFRDDHEKRDFVLGGAAAGVAAAFGAPIGGVLFSLEEAASFWNQNLFWRTLVASTISSFTLNIVLSVYHGLENFTYTGLFNLGKFDPIKFQYFEVPIFVLMGVFGGLLGAIWNALNTRLTKFRNRFLKFNWAKVVEAGLAALATVTAGCTMMYFINDCRPLGNDPTLHPVQLFCEDNEYNAAASLWFQTPEASVKSLFHDPPGSHQILTLSIFAVVYFFLSCSTYGLYVSLGIFIPTVLVGAAWGRTMAITLFHYFPQAAFLDPGKYALIGAAAQLGGVLRMTISLSVILIETTGIDTSFTFPLIITLISAKWMGDYFNEGIYDTTIKMSHIPILPWHPPLRLKDKTAADITNKPVLCFKRKERARYIYDVLRKCDHNGFPVVEDVQGDNRSNGRVCGIILRSQLIVILLNSLFEEKKQHWEKIITIENFRDVYPRYPSITSVTLHDDKVDYTVNFDSFMNPSPCRVNEDDTVGKIFRIFRALGLRHMIVVDTENRVKGIITRKDFLHKEN